MQGPRARHTHCSGTSHCLVSISLPGSRPDYRGPWLLRPRSLWVDMALPCPTRPRTHCSLVLLVLGGRGRWEARVQAPAALGAWFRCARGTRGCSPAHSSEVPSVKVSTQHAPVFAKWEPQAGWFPALGFPAPQWVPAPMLLELAPASPRTTGPPDSDPFYAITFVSIPRNESGLYFIRTRSLDGRGLGASLGWAVEWEGP